MPEQEQNAQKGREINTIDLHTYSIATMDSKEVLKIVCRSVYTWLTRYETVRATFTTTLLYLFYVEATTSVVFLLVLLFVTLGQRLYTFVFDRVVAREFGAQGRAVFISGCDSGFGHDIAKKLDSLGFTVFAGCLHPTGYGARLLKAYCSRKLHVVPLDVTSDGSVNTAVENIKKLLPKLGMWALINNAGILINGEVELMPVFQCQSVHEVNLYGVIRVTKAFLPLVRKNAGRIVTITSVFGLYSFPLIYAYTTSKHGVETLMDSLRLEMKKFGVHVSLVEPGVYDHATSIVSNEKLILHKRWVDQTWEQCTPEQKDTYGRAHLLAWIPPGEDTFKSSGDTSPVVQAVVDAITKSSPKYRYIVDGTYRAFFDEYAVIARLHKLLPTWISDKMLVGWTACDKFVK